MGARDLTEEPAEPVSVGTVFERFPASVRGAVVARAQDREPHQIRLLAVRVVQGHDPTKEVHRAPVERTTIDVAPHREVLLPFDVPFTELGPGWFCVMADPAATNSRPRWMFPAGSAGTTLRRRRFALRSWSTGVEAA